MTTSFLKAYEMAHDYISKKIQPIKNLSFDNIPNEEFEQEIPSDSEQDQSDSEDSDEDPAPNELSALKWSRKMDSYIFQFTHEYEIVKPIMNRENRKIYAALRKSDKLPVVINIIEDVNKLQLQHNIPREVILMSLVNDHPNVANILGWKRISKNVFAILMSHYVECQLRTCYWSNYLIVKYMHGLLSGLAYLHEQRVFHRDIAVNNVMWDSLKRTAIIIDFDNSCMLRSEYCTREVGRDDYDAPEKTLTFKDIKNSQRPEGYTDISDVYSAGVIFWMLLNKKDTPPSPRYLAKWIKKALQRKKFLTHIELDLMLKMLFKDPERRISASEALLHPYFQSYAVDDKYIEVENQFHTLLNYTKSKETEESEESEGSEESKKEESLTSSMDNEKSEVESNQDSFEEEYEIRFPDNTSSLNVDTFMTMTTKEEEEAEEDIQSPRICEIITEPNIVLNQKDEIPLSSIKEKYDNISKNAQAYVNPVKDSHAGSNSLMGDHIISNNHKEPLENFGNLAQLAQLIHDDEEVERLEKELQQFHIGTLPQNIVLPTPKTKSIHTLFARQKARRLNRK